MDSLNKFINSLKVKKISYEDLYYLNELLKSNLPIKTCFKLLTNSKNEYLYEDLLTRLDKGEIIEDIIYEYLPNEIVKYMANLLKRMSFKESLELALSFVKKNKENEKALEKSISYPILILFMSLACLYLFDAYGLDTILDLMKTFNTDVTFFSYARVFMRIVINVFFIGFIVLMILVLLFLNPKKITFMYILLSKYFPNSLIHIYFTEDFISLFIISLDLGYKTKEALEILKGLKNKPIVSLLAFHLDERLLEGSSLKEATKQIYFDETLERFISIASYSTDFTGVLQNYAILSNEKIKNKMKKYTKILQISSYVIIGIVIIFIYQVLFLPMKAIAAF